MRANIEWPPDYYLIAIIGFVGKLAEASRNKTQAFSGFSI